MNTLRLTLLISATVLAMHAHAQPAPGGITFKIPYKFTNISTEYESVQLTCGVSKNGEAIGSGFTQKLPLDSNGSASGTADVVAKANPGKSLADSTDWYCEAGFVRKSGGMNHVGDVAKPGTPAVGNAKGKF